MPVLFLSRVLKEKGIYETVDAVRILQARRRDVSLMVAGTGEECSRVKSYVRKYGVRNVSFPGYLRGKEKAAAFLDAYVFCLPSYAEGMPVALLEAMSFGLPAVTSPVGGIADVFVDGVNGFFVAPGDALRVAEGLLRLMDDRDAYISISNRNYGYARDHFSCAAVARKLDEIYREVILCKAAS